MPLNPTPTDPSMELFSKRVSTGKPRRSKGCTTCIRRKVKCDEKVPSCGPCLKRGRKCSGVALAIFMNMDSATLSTTSTIAARDLVGDSESPHPEWSPITSIRSKTTPLISDALAIVKHESQHVSSGQEPLPAKKKSKVKVSPESGYRTLSNRSYSPSYINFCVLPYPIKSPKAVSHQFLSHFMGCFARASPRDVIFNSWMSRLPEMLSSSIYNIDKSIAATSMMYYGRRTNDKALMMEAYRSYDAGLVSQRKSLQDIFNRKREPTIEELCIPLLMSFFEIGCCTSQTAYFQHLCGASTLLEMYGPEKCSEGILFELFYALRLQFNYASVVLRSPSLFCSAPWLTLPFAHRPKTLIDHLVDTITICTDLIARTDRLSSLSQISSSSSCNTSEREIERLSIAAQAMLLKARLDNNWPSLRKEAAKQGWAEDCFGGFRGWDGPVSYSSPTIPTTATTVPPTPRSSIFDIGESGNDIRSESIAALTPSPVTFYSTALILTLSTLFSVNQSSDLFTQQIAAHSASILAVAESLNKTHDKDVGFKCLRMILPLHVVGTMSPIKAQRKRARVIMGEWARGAVGGLLGLCEIALVALGEEGDFDGDGHDGVEGAVGDCIGGDGRANEMVVSRGLTPVEWWEKKEREGRTFGYLICTQQDLEARVGLGHIG